MFAVLGYVATVPQRCGVDWFGARASSRWRYRGKGKADFLNEVDGGARGLQPRLATLAEQPAANALWGMLTAAMQEVAQALFGRGAARQPEFVASLGAQKGR
eukprot:7857676-Alexandrium_andersonii.AAC.1